MTDNPYDAIEAQIQGQQQQPQVQTAQPALVAQNPYDDIEGQFSQARQAQAQAVNNVAQLSDADKAARAEQVGKELGVPGTIVAPNLESFEQQLAIKKTGGLVDRSPGLQDWLIQNPEKAVLAKDDFQNLSTISKIGQGFDIGFGGAAREDAMGQLAINIRNGTATQDQINQYQSLKVAAANEDQNSGVSGFAGKSAKLLGSVAGMMWGAYAQPEATAGAYGGAAISALAGPEAMPLGAFIGMQGGAISHVIKGAFANAMVEYGDKTDENGNHLPYQAQLALASITSATQGAMTILGGGVAAAPIRQAIEQAATTPTIAAALAGYGKGILSGALHGGAIGGGVEAVNAASEQLAYGLSNALANTDFKDVINDPSQMGQIGDRILASALEWAAFGGAMHGTMGSLGLINDMSRIRDSDQAQAKINALMDASESSTLRSRSVDDFRNFFQSQVQGGPVENLYIPADAVMSVYNQHGIDPFSLDDAGHQDPVFGFDQSFIPNLKEAIQTGGDVRVSTADFMSHLAGTDIGRELIKDAKPIEDGISIRSRDQAVQDWQDAMEKTRQDLDQQLSRDNSAQSPMSEVYNAEYSRLRSEMGMSAKEADINARVIAAHYETYARQYQAAGDANVKATSLYNRFQGSTEYRRAIASRATGLRGGDVDMMDGVLNDIRSGTKPPSDQDMFGLSLLDFIRNRGGITDPTGDLAAMDADKIHIGKPGVRKLVLDGNSAQASLLAGGTVGKFHPDDVARAAHEAGYFPEFGEDERPSMDDLFKAIDTEIRGNPRHSQFAGDDEAQQRQAYRDQLEHYLHDAGIDVKHPDWADNRDVKNALRLHVAEHGAEHGAGITSDIAKAIGREAAPIVLREGNEDFNQSAAHLGMTETDHQEAMNVIEKIQSGEPVDGVTDEQRAAIQSLLGDVASRESDLAAQGSGQPDATRPEQPNSRGTASLAENHPANLIKQDLNQDAAAYEARKSGASQAQGNTQFWRDSASGKIVKSVMNLFAGADKSTFLHETAHIWFEELKTLATDPNAPDVFRQDLGKLMSWMGIADPSQITEGHHEMFARSFEKYMMTGDAPSLGLVDAFSRIRSWITNIYRSVAHLAGYEHPDAETGLDVAAGRKVRMDPEIKDIFDRMLASEDEVTQMRDFQGMTQLFKTPEDMGVPPEVFSAYLAAVKSAHDAAVDRVAKKALAAAQREHEEWWKAESDKVRAEVEQQVDQRPDIQALTALRAQDNQIPKMNKAAIVRLFGGSEGILRELKGMNFGGIYSKEGGVHPDVVAERFGYHDGAEMLQDLIRLKRQERDVGGNIRKHIIDQQTHATMVERHGDPVVDGTLEDHALDAVHNTQQGEVLSQELAALEARARSVNYNGQKLLLGAIRPHEIAAQRAQGMIDQKQVRDIRSLTPYLAAERKAAKDAIQAAAKGDYAEAVKAKQRQIMANALWRAARDANAQMEKDQAMMDKLAKKQTIKSIEQSALEQAHGLLERFGIKQANPKAAPRESLDAWMSKQEAAGHEVQISDKIADPTFTQDSLDMSVKDFSDLADAIRNITHLGRAEKKILDGIKERDFEDVVKEIEDQVYGLGIKEAPREAVIGTKGGIRGELERLGMQARSWNAALLKIEQICDWLDNDNPNGAFNRLIFRRMKEALFKEFDLNSKMVDRFNAIKAGMPKGWTDGLNDFVNVPMQNIDGVPMRFRKKDIIGIALNWGNEGNRFKLLKGYGGDSYEWSKANIEAVLKQHMTEHDWRLVQGVWDSFESIYPEIEAMQKRLSGVAPERVEATPIDTGFGTIRGGYFPLMYDATRDDKAASRQAKAGADQLFEPTYTRATTPKGHTKARVDGYSAPIDFRSLELVSHKLSQHIHDLVFREAIMDASKIMADKRVQNAINRTLGVEYQREFPKWLAAVANDRNIDPQAFQGMDRLLRAARVNTTAVGIGFRLSTMFKHGFSALSNSFGELGPKWMAIGTKDLFGDRIRGQKVMDEIMAKSGEMKNRMNQYDRDIQASITHLAGQGDFAKFRDLWNHYGHMGVSLLDFGSALPTWYGAYKKGLSEGMGENDAIYYADKTVRKAHGAQSILDQARVQRGNEWQKLTTMFYGFFNHIYNRQADTVRIAKRGLSSAGDGDWAAAGKDFGTALTRSLYYVLVPAMVEAIATEGAPSDDESWWNYAGKAVLGEVPAGIPVVRDLAKAAIQGQDYEFSPAVHAVNDLIGFGRQDIPAMFDDETPVPKNEIKKAITAAGMVTGVGTGALGGWVQYVSDIIEGKENPEDIQEFARHIAFGKKRNH